MGVQKHENFLFSWFLLASNYRNDLTQGGDHTLVISSRR